MENHHVSWGNSLYMFIFNSKLLMYQRVSKLWRNWIGSIETFLTKKELLHPEEIEQEKD